MTDQTQLAETRAQLSSRGISAADLAWLDRVGWNAANVPHVASAGDAADYERRERTLNAAVAHLSFAERGASIEGKLAAGIGAALANWRDKASGDKDE